MNDKLRWYELPFAFLGIIIFMVSYFIMGFYYLLTKQNERDRAKVYARCWERLNDEKVA